MESSHTPVMAARVVAWLAPRDGGCYVDATLGAGGYTAALREAADCTVHAFDRDPEAVARAAQRFRDTAGVTLHRAAFSQIAERLAASGVAAIDGIAFDLGLSSDQLAAPGRGFSFQQDGPLDMRMDPEAGESAAEALNRLGERELADIIYTLGEERRSRPIARQIVAARQQKPIETTGELATLVRRVVKPAKDGLDPATRTFQALRLFVNDELGELDRGLAAAERLLRPEGRLVAVAFHSLEDRRVKQFLKARSNPAAGRSRPAVAAATPHDRGNPPDPSFKLLTRKPEAPDAGEIRANPRARSAKLRCAERTHAPALAEVPA